ncbi:MULTISPECIES: nuclear transport factor 2 family protein [Flavobacterium]|jgi:ketosteroid isomerase-like protein|uniref:Ketosteroid isomerase-like protein n=1 Tax=Flavobacterium lindanitolerans TaxID=428988 RepID=A0A497U0J1_9FLAO|nr:MULTISPECIES: nuclear transport factor 2 family protein [Flavobacterium]MBU7569977.1 nuclear transport factor 2 family protein [Flavobacterium sp.]PZO24940.1 MAG: nuclear transport factor 2 family protein [Flavobacteriaceae bacterium]PZQ83130.1 MAG: nuclear transport factor 2 family protein [Flavobacterium johnsoniae]MBC8645196.1 nuclear transport factor 2 family protein [Flavobacterium lindanitolerans]MDQ7961890.1 nuclear transport factor 2 family protein [Flavobacterium lindanitolerans]
MTSNKYTVVSYIEGFRTYDHKKILSCLAEDIVWDMPGFFHLIGKEAFDKEIEKNHFIENPEIEIISLTEENDTVVVEGKIKCNFRSGDLLNAAFCDVFQMENGKIKKLTSYQMTR